MKPCLGHFTLRSDVYQSYISDPTIRMNPYVYKRPAETLPPCSALLLPCRLPPRASTSPATAAALLPMGEPRPPRPPASRALRRLPPPPLLLLSGSALRTRRPTLPSHPRHRAANPPASTPLLLFLLRSASCSLSLVEGRGHRLP